MRCVLPLCTIAFWASLNGFGLAEGKLLTYLGEAGCTASYPCEMCAGDCDEDSDCRGDLICKQRDDLEAVPGCSSGGLGDYYGADYCYPVGVSLQQFALEQMFTATNGVEWLKGDGWLNKSRAHCSWFGVTCTAGNVVALRLSRNNLIGTIPEHISYLSHLELFSVEGNPLIAGELPSGFGNLIQLQQIDCAFCRFTGSIPTSFGNLKELTSLKLQNNELMYAFPDELSQLSKLHTLWLQNNQLTFLPDSVQELTALVSFKIASNRIAGTLPNLGGIYVGPYSPYKHGFKRIEEMDFSHNWFTGTINPLIVNLVNVRSIKMSHNKLTGPVPAGIGQLNDLQKLDLSHNRLSFMVVDPLHVQKHVFELCCDRFRLK